MQTRAECLYRSNECQLPVTRETTGTCPSNLDISATFCNAVEPAPTYLVLVQVWIVIFTSRSYQEAQTILWQNFYGQFPMNNFYVCVCVCMYVCLMSWGPTDRFLFMQIHSFKVLLLREKQFLIEPPQALSSVFIVGVDNSGAFMSELQNPVFTDSRASIDPQTARQTVTCSHQEVAAGICLFVTADR